MRNVFVNDIVFNNTGSSTASLSLSVNSGLASTDINFENVPFSGNGTFTYGSIVQPEISGGEIVSVAVLTSTYVCRAECALGR
jgi:hypothetical protein